ncbi:MAG TPA: GNAT family protein, partial [Thermomicrobiales bacterium]|nr:GNAT family protein [Thermomicrobiales bacterium]
DLSPLSPARARSYFDSVIMPASARGICWAIHERSTGEFIGSTAVTDFRGNDTCLFRIVIGEKSAWGKGYGTEATSLVLAETFDVLDIAEVRLEVFSYNDRARGAYRRVGFRETGRHVEWVASHQRQLHVVEMACSRRDWTPPLLQQPR